MNLIIMANGENFFGQKSGSTKSSLGGSGLYQKCPTFGQFCHNHDKLLHTASLAHLFALT